MLILLYKNKILVYQKKEGILKDLWAFPSCPKTKNNTRQIESFIKKNITAHYFLMGPLSIQKHYYTKYKDFLYPTIYRINNINFNLSAGKWISMKQLAKYPFPSVYQKIFKELRIKLERESQL